MDIITHQQLRALVEAGKAPCVSIFMPTHREKEMRQDPARLKNLIRAAEEKLIAHGMRPTLARDLLEPARRLVEDTDFWRDNQAGLAIYLCDGYQEILKLPLDTEEGAMVNDKFDIKPLLPLLNDRLFYVLAIAQNDARLLECTRTSCERIELPKDVARSIFDAIGGEDEHQTETVRHAGDASNPFSGAGAYHGQATDVQRKEQEDRNFFYRQLDDGVRRVMKDPKACVVLAAADSTGPHYRQASDLKNLCEQWVRGNPEHVADRNLHDQAMQILAPIWARELNQLQEQYGTAYAHKLASNDIYQIVPEAARGRVGVLFVPPRLRHPGKFDQEKMIVDDRSEEEDLLDVAAVHTLMTGGDIVVVDPDQVPGKGDIAAIYRYMA